MTKIVRTKLFFGLIVVLLFLVWQIGSGWARPAAQGPKIPYLAQTFLLKAQTLMKAEKFSQAAAILRSFQNQGEPRGRIASDNESPYYHYLVDFTLANCYLMMQVPQKALPHYQAALKSNPEFRAGWVNLGRCSYELREYPTAAEAFYKAYLLGEGEKDPQLLYFTAVAWFMSGKQDKVINYLQLLFKNHPKNIKLEWREVYVQACLATDQPRQALSCIEILSEESTGSRRLQWQEIRLQQYQSLKMKKKALAYVTKLIDEDPLRVLWWRGLAHFHLSEKHYRQALVALIISGYLEPLDNNGKRLLADLNQFLGIPLEAARYYEMLAQSEVDLELTRRLVDSYRALHRPNRALDWVEQGLLKTSDPALFMIQGELLFELKKYHEAERSFIAAARTPRQAGQAWLMAGYAALNLGEYSRARKNLEAAVKYSKQRQIAEQILLQLDGRL